MDRKRINILFQRQLKDELTPAEQKELREGLQTLDEETYSAWVDEYITVEENHDFSKNDVRDRIATQIREHKKSSPVRGVVRYALITVAAMLLLTCSVTLWLQDSGDDQGQLPRQVEKTEAPYEEELTLPEEEAMVTLADGTQMLFSALADDTVRHKGIEIVRAGDGSLVMRQENQSHHVFGEDARHRVAAPKGVALRVILPDSSLLWLNSGSSISIWASYNQDDRSVQLEGEAYFDIQHDLNKPFYVTAKDVKVKVLGTTFNLSAYQTDEEVKTTLIEGKVDVSASQQSLVLEPGEQAVVSQDASMSLHKNVNMSQVVAWKDGFFRFRDEPIADILRELQKWYPISAVEIPQGNTDKFTGSIQRSKKLADILAALEEVSDLSFVIKEGRVIVMK